MSWDAIGDELQRWHASGDREAGRSALAFLEPELRRMVTVLVRRTWPGDAIEDALNAHLVATDLIVPAVRYFHLARIDTRTFATSIPKLISARLDALAS